MNNLKGLLVISRIYRIPNARVRELCGVTKRVDERIDKIVLRYFGYVERIGIYKSVFVREYVGSRSVGRPRKSGLIH